MVFYTPSRSRLVQRQHDIKFQEVWNASNTIGEVAIEYGRSEAWVKTRASNIRMKGFKLKHMSSSELLPGRTQEFIDYWNSAESVDDVCGRFRLSKRQAKSKAIHLRKQGHNVKRFTEAFNKPQAVRPPANHVCWAPGSPEKVEVLRQRAANGEELWHPKDAVFALSLNPHWQIRIAQLSRPLLSGSLVTFCRMKSLQWRTKSTTGFRLKRLRSARSSRTL